MERTGLKSIDWEGYKVFEDGTILNKDGSVKSFKTSPKGYHFTNWYVGDKVITRTVHRIVWIAFNGEPPRHLEVDHINNIRTDNRLENLQLLTKSQNNQKAYDSGNRMFLFGDTNPNSLKRKLMKETNGTTSRKYSNQFSW